VAVNLTEAYSRQLAAGGSVVRSFALDEAMLAEGGTAIECPSPLSVLKDTYDRSCHWARADAYQHLMADPPAARRWRACASRAGRNSSGVPGAH
jgi:hypothetical protein